MPGYALREQCSRLPSRLSRDGLGALINSPEECFAGSSDKGLQRIPRQRDSQQNRGSQERPKVRKEPTESALRLRRSQSSPANTRAQPSCLCRLSRHTGAADSQLHIPTHSRRHIVSSKDPVSPLQESLCHWSRRYHLCHWSHRCPYPCRRRQTAISHASPTPLLFPSAWPGLATSSQLSVVRHSVVVLVHKLTSMDLEPTVGALPRAFFPGVEGIQPAESWPQRIRVLYSKERIAVEIRGEDAIIDLQACSLLSPHTSADALFKSSLVLFPLGREEGRVRSRAPQEAALNHGCTPRGKSCPTVVVGHTPTASLSSDPQTARTTP